MPLEPLHTGYLLAVLGVLLLVSVGSSRASRVLGIPVVLLFLLLGILAGSEGLGRIAFEDYHLTFRIGTVALALILFDGGLNTPLALARRVLWPSVTLATVGVAVTAGLLAIGARLLGFSWGHALLLGAIVSSTDAAAVFSVIRGGRVALRRRVATTLEAESGLNDPMAVILTIAITSSLVGGHPPSFRLLLEVVVQLAIGGALGFAIGHLTRLLMTVVRPAAGGLYPVLTLGAAFVAFGLPTMAGGSGFLAVYVAGVIIGNATIPYRGGILRVHDALAWLCQILMFLAMGLLVFPTRVAEVAVVGVIVAALLVFVARPIAVLLCLAPFRYPRAEMLYVAWGGLRGAVPIVLATYPVLAGVTGSERIFDIVFFVVALSVLLQGSTARWVMQKLNLHVLAPPAPPAVLEVTSARPLRGEVISFHVNDEAIVAGVSIADVPFPPGAGACLVVRGDELLTPRDATELQPGDHVYVFSKREDRPEIGLLFGRRED